MQHPSSANMAIGACSYAPSQSHHIHYPNSSMDDLMIEYSCPIMMIPVVMGHCLISNCGKRDAKHHESSKKKFIINIFHCMEKKNIIQYKPKSIQYGPKSIQYCMNSFIKKFFHFFKFLTSFLNAFNHFPFKSDDKCSIKTVLHIIVYHCMTSLYVVYCIQ